jgi:hypothetical protein
MAITINSLHGSNDSPNPTFPIGEAVSRSLHFFLRSTPAPFLFLFLSPSSSFQRPGAKLRFAWVLVKAAYILRGGPLTHREGRVKTRFRGWIEPQYLVVVFLYHHPLSSRARARALSLCSCVGWTHSLVKLSSQYANCARTTVLVHHTAGMAAPMLL